MLAEFIDKLRSLASDADRVQLTVHEELPERIFVRNGSELTVHDVPPSRRAHSLRGLPDIVAAVEDGEIAKDPEVYHDEVGVQVLLERQDRRSTVVMPLRLSERFKRLQRLRAGESMDVQGAMKLLRFDLHGTGVDPVISALRSIDFTRRSSGGATAEHGKESLGRSVEAAVQQADKVPEEFTVKTSVYTNPGVRDLSVVSIRCGVFLDLQDERIVIQVLADELDAAVNRAQLALGGALQAALGTTPVFYGAP